MGRAITAKKTPETLKADWPAPGNIFVNVSTREHGYSEGCYSSMNLGLHVGDHPEQVKQNRQLLWSALIEASGVQWIKQVHGSTALEINELETDPPEADALFTRKPKIALAVLTADCLPVCFTNKAGTEIAIAHAGWRGLAGGVLENTLQRFSTPVEEVLVWLGPAIGSCHFEVGEEVRQVFLKGQNEQSKTQINLAFIPSINQGKWQADLYKLARVRLNQAGVNEVYGGGLCTYCDDKRFYSYRRNKQTGRFATTIHIT